MTLVFVSCRSASLKSEAQLRVNEKPNESNPRPTPTWSGSMKSLHEQLNTLEPLIFDSRQFVLEKNQSVLKFTIQSLAEESKNVSHSPTLIARDPTVRYVAARFAEDLLMTEEAFNSGKKDFARYRLLKVTSYCVECHTRTQTGPEFKFKFVESFLNKMTATNQVEYLIATRQFDRAFDIATHTLKSFRKGSALAWDVENVTRLGLQIAVQFKNDINDAQKLVSMIENNLDSPAYLKENVNSWKASLIFWKNNPINFESLDDIRILLKNRKSEIDDMRLISNLLLMLSNYPKNDELGEILFLIGQSYEKMNKIDPLLLHENYYESCIRNVPHTKWSRKCFKNLKSSIELGYTGSGGTRIPMGVQVHLNILRKEAE